MTEAGQQVLRDNRSARVAQLAQALSGAFTPAELSQLRAADPSSSDWRRAFDGYHVVLATDAMAARDAGAHQNSVRRIFPRLGETATTDGILAMLDKTR